MPENSTQQEIYKRGERLKHRTRPEWGLGEVLNDQLGEHIQVIFEDAGVKKFKVGMAPFVKVTGEESKSEYLSALVKRHLHPKGKSKSWTDGPVVPFARVVEDFLRHFPRGFKDPLYSEQERDYKQRAHEFALEKLGRDDMQTLLANAEYSEICNRGRALLNKTNLLSLYEKLWLRKGLDTPGREQLFAQSLTLALRFPGRHIFVKPEVTKYIARVLPVDIEYTPEVTWLTYSRVQQLAKTLVSRLIAHDSDGLAPRDMIDVQSFIWVAGSYDS